MRNDTGIFNSQSSTNEYIRELRSAPVRSTRHVLTSAVPEPGLFVICQAYRDAENWTAWNAIHGQHEAAEVSRQTAARFRAQLREMLAGLVVAQ